MFVVLGDEKLDKTSLPDDSCGFGRRGCDGWFGRGCCGGLGSEGGRDGGTRGGGGELLQWQNGFLLLFIVLQSTAIVLANDKLDKTRLRDDSCGFGRRSVATGLVVEETTYRLLLPEVELADTFCDGSPPFLKKRKEFPSSNVFLLAVNLYLQAKLYNLVTKIVAAQAFKTVKLGQHVHQNLAKPQNGAIHEGDHEVHRRTTDQGVEPGCEDVEQEEDSLKNWDAFASSCSSSNDREQEEAPLPYSLVAQAKPAKIKKTVSINDRVEEIDTGKKMKRRKSTEKLPSIDLEEDIVQPVKSILKKDSFEH
ncbi:hypothetical protein D5086_009927, partial [Populus alba]